MTNFVTAPAPSLDKRSVKSDQITVTVDPKQPDTYTIRATYDKDVQVSLEVTRLPGVPGWKLGAGPRGGMTFFGTYKPPKEGASAGPAVDGSGGSDGYAIHRFWPRCSVKGVISMSGSVIELDPATCRGMLVHAIQGMRPNLVASRWAFADFQTPSDDGVSLVSMQFTTPIALGSKTVNIGSVVVDDKLVAISCSDNSDPEASGSGHDDAVLDADTGYKAPYTLNYRWRAPALDGKPGDAPVVATIKHSIRQADAPMGEGAKYASVGLIEKVDVLAEIPALIKRIVHATGTQPYIYQVRIERAKIELTAQWLNTVEATISLPAIGDKPARTLHPKGQLFCEVCGPREGRD